MKNFLLIFLLILLSFSLVSAVEFNINENYRSGETIITRVSGNFLTPPTKDSVFFYEDHVRIPVDYGIAKVNEDYYIYASLEGKAQGNYSMAIENVQYMSGSQVKDNDLIRNFTITNETAAFSLKPGVIATAADFYLEVQNLLDQETTISVNTDTNTTSTDSREIIISSSQSKQASVALRSGEVKKIYFELGDGQVTFQTVELKTANLTYKVPVYIYSASTVEKEESFRLEPSTVIASVPTNTPTKKTIYLYNTGNTEIKNITLSLSDSISAFVNLSNYTIKTLAPDSNFPINLFFLSPGELEVSGNLKANMGTVIAYSQISLKFLSNYIPPNETAESTSKNCTELKGTPYNSETENCGGETKYAADKLCCMGKVTKKETTSSNTGRVIGIILLVLVAVGLVWFYFKRYRRARKPIDLLKIAGKAKKD